MFFFFWGDCQSILNQGVQLCDGSHCMTNYVDFREKLGRHADTLPLACFLPGSIPFFHIRL